MLLPPNAYRADARAVRRPLPRGRQGRAADRGLQQPDRHQGRPRPRAARRAARRGADRRRQGVHRRRAPGLRDRRARARPRRRCAAPTTSCWSSRSPARRAGSPATRTRFPRACADAVGRGAGAATSTRALPLYRQLHPLLRWDSKTEFVQAIKLSMDIVGRYGGPCRPPRVPLTAGAGRGGARAPPRPPSRRPGAERIPRASPDPMRTSASSTRSTRTPRACRPG